MTISCTFCMNHLSCKQGSTLQESVQYAHIITHFPETGDFPPTQCCLKYGFVLEAHTTIAVSHAVKKSHISVMPSRAGFSTQHIAWEKNVSHPERAAQNTLLSFSGVGWGGGGGCSRVPLWVKPLVTQQLWPSTLSGRLPGCVAGLVSSLWFLNETRAPIRDADQTVWSPRPNLKNKKWKTVKAHVSRQTPCVRGSGFLTVSALLMH